LEANIHPILTSHPAFQPKPSNGRWPVPVPELSIKDSEDLFRVGFSWGEWVGIWVGEACRLTVLGYRSALLRDFLILWKSFARSLMITPEDTKIFIDKLSFNLVNFLKKVFQNF
jgi:hypothetical protein